MFGLGRRNEVVTEPIETAPKESLEDNLYPISFAADELMKKKSSLQNEEMTTIKDLKGLQNSFAAGIEKNNSMNSLVEGLKNETNRVRAQVRQLILGQARDILVVDVNFPLAGAINAADEVE